nr:16S rRNA (cytosine(1402)-N(4))-methyltransferase RsmH [Thiorhodococcus mannitoliphagus]
MQHRSVLLEESVSALVVRPNGIYVDGTFGRGGHSRAILARLGAGGRLIGMDRDPQAVTLGAALEGEDARFSVLHTSFEAIGDVLLKAGVLGRVNGILLDLGVSSPQLDQPERGFSFNADGPLDMRMNPRAGMTAAAWLASASQEEIEVVLRDYGEERFAKRIARAIVKARAERPLETTSQLAELVSRAIPTREPGKHPATRTFQAVRIQVNDELGSLRRCLDQVCGLLDTAGRLVVISFHSLEDRIVKRFIRDEARGPLLPKGLPVQASQTQGRLRALGKALRPAADEIRSNPRSRSAVMRVAERLP